MKCVHWIIIGWLCVALSSPVRAATVVWRKIPIPVELVVGVEQRVVLPSDGAVGLPPTLGNNNIFRTLVTGATAYWTALEAFESQRIKVRLDSGQYLLFDVSARVEKSPPAAQDSIQVVLSSENDLDGASGPASASQAPATLFELIRYAAQDVYAPARLVASVPGVRAVPLGLAGNMTALYDQGMHKGLIIQPHKAWAADGLYVTAFMVTNEHTHRMQLDNRKVQHAPSATRNGVAPHFVASTFFHAALTPRGEPGNRTTLFIVTDRPIRTVLRGIR